MQCCNAHPWTGACRLRKNVNSGLLRCKHDARVSTGYDDARFVASVARDTCPVPLLACQQGAGRNEFHCKLAAVLPTRERTFEQLKHQRLCLSRPGRDLAPYGFRMRCEFSAQLVHM